MIHVNEISKLAKDLNRVRRIATAQVIANTNKKRQITMWNAFFKKLLEEGRITKDELKTFSPKKIK